jgi:hypothetical protein
MKQVDCKNTVGNVPRRCGVNTSLAMQTRRGGSPNTEASWLHEKHDILSFFLGTTVLPPVAASF